MITTYTIGRPRKADAPARVSPDAFRGLMSAFPTGVAVVAAVDQSGHPHGMTCTSLSSVTLSPPTLLVCLALDSGTLGAIRSRNCFTVNLLHARSRRAAEVFSSAAPGRFSRVEWQPSRRLGQPWLCDDAFAVAECVVSHREVVGDHALVLGEVVDVQHTADVPLMYGMRQFSRWYPRAEHEWAADGDQPT